MMVWVNDTLTADKLRLVSRLPSVCTMARGRMPMMTSVSTWGAVGRRVSQLNATAAPRATRAARPSRPLDGSAPAAPCLP